jgi:hypothetical protein
MFALLDYRDWPRCRLHSARTERMTEKRAVTPSAMIVQMKKKAPLDLAMLPPTPFPIIWMTGMDNPRAFAPTMANNHVLLAMTPRLLCPQILCAIRKNSCSDCKASAISIPPHSECGDLATVPFNTASNRSCNRVSTVAPDLSQRRPNKAKLATRVIQAILRWLAI